MYAAYEFGLLAGARSVRRDDRGAPSRQGPASRRIGTQVVADQGSHRRGVTTGVSKVRLGGGLNGPLLDGAAVRLALGRDSTDGEHRHGGKNAKDHDDDEQLDEGESLFFLRTLDLTLHWLSSR